MPFWTLGITFICLKTSQSQSNNTAKSWKSHNKPPYDVLLPHYAKSMDAKQLGTEAHPKFLRQTLAQETPPQHSRRHRRNGHWWDSDNPDDEFIIAWIQTQPTESFLHLHYPRTENPHPSGQEAPPKKLGIQGRNTQVPCHQQRNLQKLPRKLIRPSLMPNEDSTASSCLFDADPEMTVTTPSKINLSDQISQPQLLKNYKRAHPNSTTIRPF